MDRLERDYITEDVRRVIGAQSAWAEATHPVERSEVRRFFQATIDPNPRYWNEEAAKAGRAGALVAPPAFPVHAFRRAAEETRDPLDSMGDPDFDGVSRALRPGLPPVPVPLSGILNGGYEYEFYSYAKVGERILCRSTYRDIYQRTGKSGTLVFIIIEDEYQTTDKRPLLKSVNTMIMR